MFDRVLNIPPLSDSMTQKLTSYSSNNTAFHSCRKDLCRVLQPKNNSDIFLIQFRVQLYTHKNRE